MHIKFKCLIHFSSTIPYKRLWRGYKRLWRTRPKPQKQPSSALHENTCTTTGALAAPHPMRGS